MAALFSAAEEEDYEDEDDTGVLPTDQVKELKAKLKQLKGDMKLARKEGRTEDREACQANARQVEATLARHKALEDEQKQLKADIRATEKKRDGLVNAAREKISPEQAREVILERLKRTLLSTYESYLRADQRECLARLENLHDKYAVTAEDIEKRRDEASAKLRFFLVELGYE